MWLGILKNDFVPNLTLFPRAANVELFTFFASHYGVDGGIVKNWRGPGYVPTYQPTTTWWAPYTEFADPATAPAWAAHMRAYLQPVPQRRRLVDGHAVAPGRARRRRR